MIYLIGAVYVIAITLLIQDGLRKSRRARTPIITGRWMFLLTYTTCWLSSWRIGLWDIKKPIS